MAVAARKNMLRPLQDGRSYTACHPPVTGKQFPSFEGYHYTPKSTAGHEICAGLSWTIPLPLNMDKKLSLERSTRLIRSRSFRPLVREITIPSKFQVELNEVKNLKRICSWRSCRKFGQGPGYHGSDVSLLPGAPFHKQPFVNLPVNSDTQGIRFIRAIIHSLYQQSNIIEIQENNVTIKIPLFDDVSSYIPIGMEENHHIAPSIIPTRNYKQDAVPGALSSRSFWKYLLGTHSSPRRRILGSFI